MNPTKGDVINFTTKTSGLFEIIEPVMESDELFDANLLEQTVNALIGEGKRNFAVDLSKIDYLYSDSINKFINLNHKVLNVYGRLTLLSPGEKVSKILQRAGIQNFLKIYSNIEELQKASDEIIQQTTAININEINSYKNDNTEQSKPQSEFEDFRSEIGKAIEGTTEDGSVLSDLDKPDENGLPSDFQNFSQPPIQPPPKPKFDYSQLPNLPSFEAPQKPSQESDEQQYSDEQPAQQYDDQQYSEQPAQQFDDQQYSEQPAQQFDNQQYSEQYDQQYPEQPAQQYDDQQYSEQPGQQYADQQYTEPSSHQYSDQSSQQDFSYSQSPQVEDDYKQTQKIPSSQDMQQQQPGQGGYPKTSFDRDELFEDDQDTQKKPLVTYALGGLAILVVIGVIFIFFNPLSSKKSTSKNVIESPKVETIPEIKPSVAEEKPPEPKPEPKPEKVVKKPTKKTPVKTVSKPKPKPKPRPKPSKPKPSSVSSNKIVITSYPPNATVTNNGKVLGTTPYTWKDPNVYGMVVIGVEKNGYVSKKINFEFVGGSTNKHIVLIKKSVPIVKTIPEKPKTKEKDYLSFEPEDSKPKPKPKPVVRKTTPTPAPKPKPKPVPTPPPAAKVASADGGTIFISSLPPMADVYMDGVKIGKTNIAELKITAGTHTMKFVKGSKTVEKKMTFTAGKNPSQLIRLK